MNTISSKPQNKINNETSFLMKEYPVYATAIHHHRTHKGHPISIKDAPFLLDIYMCNAPEQRFIKSTQCGLTEWMVVRAMVRASMGKGVFYVLPTEVIRNRFIKNRFDLSVEQTSYYRAMVRDDNNKAYSVSLKHVGKGSIAFVGSNSPAAFTEFPADDLMVDEFDRCMLTNVLMGEERLSASDDRSKILISNPTIEDYGIDEEFKLSDQRHWYLSCGCGNTFTIDFFSHIVRQIDDHKFVIRDPDWTHDSTNDIRVICDKCGAPVDRFQVGKWIQHAKSDIVGWRITKMFSTNTRLVDLVEKFDRGLSNPSVMQRFYNADLGKAFTASGAKITRGMITACINDYLMPTTSTGTCVMGVDVGSKMHVRINEILSDGRIRAVYIGSVNTKADVEDLYRQYNVVCGVVDAMPEERLSKQLCISCKGMFRAYYSHNKKNDLIVDFNSLVVNAVRTSTLDAVRELFLSKKLLLPKNVLEINEYANHVTAATRVFLEEKDEYSWVEGSNPDHFFHAENYALMAYRMISNRR